MNKKVNNTERIYEYLAYEWHNHTRIPTYSEIAEEVGLSVTTIGYHLEKLEGQGRITREPNKARSIRIVDPSEDTPDETTEEVYQFICEHIGRGIIPSQTEIAEGCYISRSSVRRYLARLEGQKRIRVGEGIRDIQILDN